MAANPQIPKTPTSPKVTAASITALVLAIAIGAINAISPELFEFMGAFGPVVYAAIVAGGAHLAGYQKSDHVRDVGAVLAQDHGVEGADAPEYRG